MLAALSNFFRRADTKSDRAIFIVMAVFGFTGLAASFALSIDEFILLNNPHAILNCSLNIILNCAGVMKTWQAHAFGFPNMFIGLMGFPLVLMIASLGLSRAKFPRWFAICMELGLIFWTCFAYWLFFNSVYIIQILCPWCLLVTFSMTMLLASSTCYSVRHNTFKLPARYIKSLTRCIDKGYYQMVVAAWIVAMISLVILKFGAALFA